MLLQDKSTGSLVEIEDLIELTNPVREEVTGRDQQGEEEQDPVKYPKASLVFPSGESLPKCWIDPEYQSSK